MKMRSRSESRVCGRVIECVYKTCSFISLEDARESILCPYDSARERERMT